MDTRTATLRPLPTTTAAPTTTRRLATLLPAFTLRMAASREAATPSTRTRVACARTSEQIRSKLAPCEHACGEDSALQVLQVLGGLEQAYQPCAMRERGVCVDRWEPRAQYASHASASSTLQAVRSGTPCSCRALDTFESLTESRSLLVCLVGFCFFTMDIFCVSSFSR